MGLFWQDCFLCHGKGKLTVGDNFNIFHESKDEKCPICNSSGQIALKILNTKSFIDRLRYFK